MIVDDRMSAIEQLIGQLELSGDVATRETARSLVALVLELHREALSRLLSGDHRRALLEAAKDPALAAVLLLHDLHPAESVSTRATTEPALIPSDSLVRR